jgi:hypothetical protein
LEIRAGIRESSLILFLRMQQLSRRKEKKKELGL